MQKSRFSCGMLWLEARLNTLTDDVSGFSLAGLLIAELASSIDRKFTALAVPGEAPRW